MDAPQAQKNFDDESFTLIKRSCIRNETSLTNVRTVGPSSQWVFAAHPALKSSVLHSRESSSRFLPPDSEEHAAFCMSKCHFSARLPRCRPPAPARAGLSGGHRPASHLHPFMMLQLQAANSDPQLPSLDAGFYSCGYFLFLGSFPFCFCYAEKPQHLVSQYKQIRLPQTLNCQRLGRIPDSRCEELPVAKYTDKKDV